MSDSKQEKLIEEGAKKSGMNPLFLIFLTIFIDLVGFGLIIPVLPTYARQLHANDQTVGLLMASYSLMQFLFTPFLGRLSDKIGRRPILLVTLTASSIGYTLWGLSNSLILLFCARMVAGAASANISVAQAYVTDVTTAENRAKGMGMVGAAFGLGFVLGPAIGGFFADFGLPMVGFIAAAFSAIDLLLTFFLLPEPTRRSHAGSERFGLDPLFYWNTLRDPKLKTLLLIYFIWTFAFSNMETTLVMLTTDQYKFNPNMNRWLLTFVGVVIVAVQGGLIGRLNRKFGEKNLIGVGCAAIVIGLVLTPATSNPVVLYVALAVLAFGSGLTGPSNQSLMSKIAAQDRIGGTLGVGQSLATLGRIAGPTIGGIAYQHLGHSYPYWIGAVASMVALILSFKLPSLPVDAPEASS